MSSSPLAAARPWRADPLAYLIGPHDPADFLSRLYEREVLIVRRDDGSEVDRFRHRLMVPIARDTGSIIAFGGRALDADQVPKYLNSPETPIYTKSRTLYGLHLTKSLLRQAGFVIIVEGYFDFAQVCRAATCCGGGCWNGASSRRCWSRAA